MTARSDGPAAEVSPVFAPVARPLADPARLAALRETAGGTGNLLPPIREALRAGCTVGEVCGALREVFGEYQPES